MIGVDEFLGHLSPFGDISSRAMFGGHGVYWRGMIFAIVYRDRLYLKVDESSKPDYLTRGMGPFRPNERQTLKSYYEVPQDVLDDQEALLSWSGDAIRAAQVTAEGPS
ncbi:TfoX/Sxy family protein [Tautonia sp. JC769]|uniref:TfoX/Sxy family protein n=1 Tax=Tautonia sp. JC769 TaxID=3232135 RepID=UPI0034590BFB